MAHDARWIHGKRKRGWRPRCGRHWGACRGARVQDSELGAMAKIWRSRAAGGDASWGQIGFDVAGESRRLIVLAECVLAVLGL